MCNKQIREAIREARIYQYQVAAELGISEATLVRWMRTELSEEKRIEALEAIRRVANG